MVKTKGAIHRLPELRKEYKKVKKEIKELHQKESKIRREIEKELLK